MSRWFGFIDDPSTGGSTFDELTAPIAAPDTFVPVTSAQVDPGLRQHDRDNENRGRRANVAPRSFASAPTMTLEARAYPKLARKLLRLGLGGAITSAGAAPAAISSTLGPLQSGDLPAIIGWLLREGQLDRLTGLVVNELEFNFAIEEEGTISSTLWGLWHDVDDPNAIDDPTGPSAALPAAGYPGYVDTFMLRDATAFVGATLVELTDLAGFGFTFNNNLIDDMRSRFRPNHNIESIVVDGERHDIWYPDRHKLGPQAVTGRIDFSDVEPDRELRRIVTHAEKLVFEVAAGPLGTTPDADEMMRLTFYKHAPTGGGAEPLQREGDQVSSYEFSGYLSEADNKDVEATVIGTAALT